MRSRCPGPSTIIVSGNRSAHSDESAARISNDMGLICPSGPMPPEMLAHRGSGSGITALVWHTARPNLSIPIEPIGIHDRRSSAQQANALPRPGSRGADAEGHGPELSRRAMPTIGMTRWAGARRHHRAVHVGLPAHVPQHRGERAPEVPGVLGMTVEPTVFLIGLLKEGGSGHPL